MMLTSGGSPGFESGRKVFPSGKRKKKVGEYAFGTGSVTASPGWGGAIGMPTISRPDLGLGPGATGLPALGLRPSHTGASFRRYPRFYYQRGTSEAFPDITQDGLGTPDTVPGPGSTDSVPAMLTPEEAVLNPNASELAGRGNIRRLNRAGNALAARGVHLAGPKAVKTAPGRLAKKQGLIPPGMPVRAQGGLGKVLDPVAEIEERDREGTLTPSDMDWIYKQREAAAEEARKRVMNEASGYQGGTSYVPYSGGGIGYVPPQDVDPRWADVQFSGGMSPYQVMMLRRMMQQRQQQGAAVQSPGGLANLLGLFSGGGPTSDIGTGSAYYGTVPGGMQVYGPTSFTEVPGYQDGREYVQPPPGYYSELEAGNLGGGWNYDPEPTPIPQDIGEGTPSTIATGGGPSGGGGGPAETGGGSGGGVGNIPVPPGMTPPGQLVPPGAIPSVPYQIAPLPPWANFVPGGQYVSAARNIFNLGSQAGSALKNLFRDRGGSPSDVQPGSAAAPGGPEGGYYDPSYLMSIGYTPGQGVGSLWPQEGFGGARGGPLAGGTAGLGSFGGGNLGGLGGMLFEHMAQPSLGGLSVAQAMTQAPWLVPGMFGGVQGPGAGPQPGGGGRVLPRPV